MNPYVSLLLGLILLVSGGEALVRGAVGISRRFGLSKLLIGMTVVAFGTSAPELLVSLQGVVGGHSDLAVGNVVGSNLCNIAMILGLASIVRAQAVDRGDIRPDAIAMAVASVALVLLGFAGVIERWQGAVLFGGLVVFIWLSYRREIQAGTAETDWHAEEECVGRECTVRLWPSALLVTGSVFALAAGASLLVEGALGLASLLGISESVVALTVVAFGTSLPELATSVTAAARHHPDVAVGNVLGSNLFNIAWILGLTSMVEPVQVAPHLARIDIPLMAAVSVGVAVLLVTRGRVGRLTGAILFGGYAFYVAVLFATA